MQKQGIARNEDIDALSEGEKIRFIESTAVQIISSPEEELNRLHSLFYLTNENNPSVVRYAVLSITEVMKDIVPLYKIDIADSANRLKQAVAKDERKIIAHELELAKFYDKFLERLDSVRDYYSLLTRRSRKRAAEQLRGPAGALPGGAVQEAALLQPIAGDSRQDFPPPPLEELRRAERARSVRRVSLRGGKPQLL